ncbi:glycoside hydrolase family 35 protein [Streptomyces viridosporus]|uniref:beta-galactosidase n=1 Tax=Streptomyces viridosporus T7A TaxID=665577 RepID=A0ABX6AEX6_STRVD|nr:beta-galactosidase [Streptomyces viridosporus]QEU85579.1 beta-galactosidase [Streptomyces viridosporus T7A]
MELSRRTFTALAGTAALGLALAGSSGAVPGPRGARTVPTGPPPPAPSADGKRHRVGFDRYSLLVDGRRLVLWSGEVHPFRLPSPSLWRDVLQKLRAHGHNAVTVHVPWNHHSPAPGRYDFTGVRDLDLFLRTAAEERLYVVLRPGPGGAADVDAGGLPGWLTVAEGTARTADPAYLRHVDAWLSAVDTIAVRHLFTRGGGTVLLYQLEDGSGVRADDPAGRAHLTHLYEKVRADRIDVPLFHTGGGPDGSGAPELLGTGREKGRLLHGIDVATPPGEVPPDLGHFGEHGTGAGTRTPGFLAGAAGGAADPWGGAPSGGKGYAQVRRTHDAAYERRNRLTHLANGITAHTVRMAFGGTSWGWLPSPGVYTSYDYGAAIDEGRRPTPKLAPLHQLGHLVRTVPDLARLDPAEEVRAADERITVYHLANPDTDAQVYVLRNDSAEQVTSMLPGTDVDVPVTVGARDAKLLVTGLELGRRKLAYSTAQPMLNTTVGRLDIAVFTGRHREVAQVALDCDTQPVTNRLDDEPAWAYDRGRLNVVVPLGVGGLSRVLVEGGDSETPMLLLFTDDATALRLWPYETPSGPLLVYGPALLRSAALRGSTVHLTGDVVGATGLEVWAPRGITTVTWNGRPVRTHLSRAGSLLMEGLLPAAPRVRLPALGGWRRRDGNPESEPDFDDSAWTAADRTSSRSTTPVPEGRPVLFADDYGFHYGDVWYRGRFEDARGLEAVSLSYSTGTQGLLMAWLDGRPLGTHRMPVPDEDTAERGTWTATATFEVPGKLRRRGRRVLSVLVRRMQHDGGRADGGAGDARPDAYRAARGLLSADFEGGSRDVDWRIRGAVEPDRVRGPLNNGGLHGEREGWHLPGYDDRDWEAVEFPREDRRQGVAWYRTDFRLDVDPGVDASIGLTLEDDPERAYRVQIFLNGWNMGQYINDVGPQHTFVLPNGILRTRGSNTLALAVLSDGTTPAGPRDVRLTLLGAAEGGVPVEAVDSPGR